MLGDGLSSENSNGLNWPDPDNLSHPATNCPVLKLQIKSSTFTIFMIKCDNMSHFTTGNFSVHLITSGSIKSK